MELEDARKKIASLSRSIDELEMTVELIRSSNVLCFTTMDRGPEETVSIEFTEPNPDGSKLATNSIIKEARNKMISYLQEKIKKNEESIKTIIKMYEKGE